MVANERVESDVALVEILMDSLGYCDEETSSIIMKIVESKLESLAKSQHPKVAYLQAHLPQFGKDSEELDLRFNSLMKVSSDAGVAEAQYEHACRHWERGEHQTAISLYKVSAEQGYPPSQYCYGLGLYDGIGIEKNEIEGLHFIELAAGQLYNLALEFLLSRYQDDASAKHIEKRGLYSKMLVWSEEKS